MITYSVATITERLERDYNMKCHVIPLTEAVSFYGTELECYKMAYQFKNKESRVAYSENLKTWHVTFYDWFPTSFAQQIKH